MTYDLAEIDKRVVELTRAEMTAIQIAEELGVSRACVNRSRIRTGVRVRRPPKRPDYETLGPKYAELHRQGYTDRGIAERLRVSKDTARRIGEKLGLQANGRFKYDPEVLERMYHDGASDAQIAEELGGTPLEISHARRRRRLVQERKPAIPEHRKPEVLSLLDDGASYGEVARTLGISQSAIRYHFPGRGWSRKQVGEHAAIRELERKVGIT